MTLTSIDLTTAMRQGKPRCIRSNNSSSSTRSSAVAVVTPLPGSSRSSLTLLLESLLADLRYPVSVPLLSIQPLLNPRKGSVMELHRMKPCRTVVVHPPRDSKHNTNMAAVVAAAATVEATKVRRKPCMVTVDKMAATMARALVDMAASHSTLMLGT